MKIVATLSLAAIAAVYCTSLRAADPHEETAAPKVILKGEGASESAPHGKGNVYAPTVMREGNVLKMWYGGQGADGHDRISYAESRGGAEWARKGVVLKDDKANHVNDPCVLKIGSTYFMYFTHTDKDVVDRIDVAVSPDGVAWEPRGAVIAPGTAGSWDGLSVGRPSVIYEDGLFKMWYDGRKDFPPGAPVKGVPMSPTSSRSVGYATSKDGFHWVRYAHNPVYGNNAGAVDVGRIGGSYLMLYESHEGTRSAVSQDGLKWGGDTLLLRVSGTAIDAFGHVTPHLFSDAEGRRYRLFTGAAAAAAWNQNCIIALDLSADQISRALSPAPPKQ